MASVLLLSLILVLSAAICHDSEIERDTLSSIPLPMDFFQYNLLHNCFHKTVAKRCLRLQGGLDDLRLPATFEDIGECLYSCLGLANKFASLDEIRSAYRKKALRWHPDKNPDCPGYAEHRFKEIQRAYVVLTNSDDRAFYDSHRDRILAAGQQRAKLRSTSAWFSNEGVIKRRRGEGGPDKPRNIFDVLMRRKQRFPCSPGPRSATSGPSAFDYLMRRGSSTAATDRTRRSE